MDITWYGTASISIETKHERIVLDPFVPVAGSGIDVHESDFAGFEHIFLTHGHIDHLVSVPGLTKHNDARIWCTKTPASTLANKGVSRDRICTIKPGDIIALRDIELEVFQGRHIRFDKTLVKNTLLNKRMVKHALNLPWLLYQNAICKENGETVAYRIEAEGRTILVLGSLGLAPEVAYPSEVDLLILPFQGASDLITPSIKIIGKIRPKAILLDHFDDTFPPISNTIPLDLMEKRMRVEYPDIKLLIPQYKKPITL